MSTLMKHDDEGNLSISGELKELDRGLVLYLDGTYDDVNGWFVDKSGNGNHGVPYNGATTGTGVVGDGMSFDSSLSQYISITPIKNIIQSNYFTISGFYMPEDLVTSSGLFSYGYTSGSKGWLHLQRYSSYNSFRLHYTTTDDGTSVLSNNRFDISDYWYSGILHHYAFVRDDDDIYLYLDGAIADSATGITGTIVSGNDVLLGRYSATDTWYYDGMQDEIRIYDRALSSEEVSQLYNLGCAKLHDGSNVSYNSGDLVVPELIENNGHDVTDGLVLWLDGSQDIDGKFIDRSGNGNHGIPYNGATTGTGVVGDGMSFDGVDDYVNCGSIINGWTSASLSFWIDTTQVSEYREIIYASAGGGNRGIGILFDSSNRIRYEINTVTGGRQYKVSDYIITPNSTYITLVFDETSYKIILYINGEYYEDFACVNWGTIYNQYGVKLMSHHGTSWFCNGILDEIRIYDRALTPDEIQTLYNRGMKMKYNKLMVSEFKEGESL